MRTIKISTNQLIETSLKIIIDNQGESGALIASPTFPTYHYCWFRDSSFISYALDLYGEHERSRKFHEWAAKLILQRKSLIENVVKNTRRNEPLGDTEILHTRYTMDGGENYSVKWENFQLDGFGTWLWSVARHAELSGMPLSKNIIEATQLTGDYLSALWERPCYDCWEEFKDEIHPHTLAAVSCGLRQTGNQKHLVAAAVIARYLDLNAKPDGYWQKFIGNSQVDSSLIGMAVPYGVSDLKSPEMVETIRRIEIDLLDGGLLRYSTDTYYGGGRWILLTAWLGWYYCELGEVEKAKELRAWIEGQANEDGLLPEQVAKNVNDVGMIQPWEQKWGSSANPLVWSHANYLTLCKKIEQAEK